MVYYAALSREGEFRLRDGFECTSPFYFNTLSKTYTSMTQSDCLTLFLLPLQLDVIMNLQIDALICGIIATVS